MALIPVIGAALLPKLVCPACWPAYAGLLSALGLGFINYTPYLLPLLLVFLGITLFSLGYRASRRRGYRPLIVGLIASLGLVLGKFVFESDWGLYSGLAVLIAASVWNSWPRGANSTASPQECCEAISKSSCEKGGEKR